MRRGEVAAVMYSLRTFGDTCRFFKQYAAVLRAKAEGATDGHAQAVAAACRDIESSCETALAKVGAAAAAAACGRGLKGVPAACGLE